MDKPFHNFFLCTLFVLNIKLCTMIVHNLYGQSLSRNCHYNEGPERARYHPSTLEIMVTKTTNLTDAVDILSALIIKVFLAIQSHFPENDQKCMMLRPSEWHMDRSNWTRYGYLTDIDSKWRKPAPYGIYFIKSDIFTIVRLRHFMDCMVFHYGVPSSSSSRRMNISDWFLSLMGVPRFARDYISPPSRMC